jgi:hypothetical protein
MAIDNALYKNKVLMLILISSTESFFYYRSTQRPALNTQEGGAQQISGPSKTPVGCIKLKRPYNTLTFHFKIPSNIARCAKEQVKHTKTIRQQIL